MRKMVVFNGAAARVTLEGDVDEVYEDTYSARGRVGVQVRAKTMSRKRLLRDFYESLVPFGETYEEALEEHGPGFTDDLDDLLPDLGKATIRIHSKTLCEWKDASFSIGQYDDVWNDAGMQCEADSPEATRMRLGSGASGADVTIDMAEVAKSIERAFLEGRLIWPPTFDVKIGVFLDYQTAQGEGALFKVLNYTFKLCPARLPLQAITLDAAAHRYQLIAGPARGPVRFVANAKSDVELASDPARAPAGCTSMVVTWGCKNPLEVVAIGALGEIAHARDAVAWARSTFYRLEITGVPAEDAPIELTHETTEDFDAIAMKLREDGSMVPATEAVVTVQPPGDRDLWTAVVAGESHDRHVVLSVDQARGARAARNDSKAALTSPDDYILRRTDVLHVKLTLGGLELTRTLHLAITLPRWFPLEGSDAETHLRINYATLVQGLRDAITRYNDTHGGPARFNVAARNGFDKLAAGAFLFGHNPPDDIARIYYFTEANKADDNGNLAREWLNTLSGCPKPATRPSALSEASLFVRIIELYEEKGDKLTPGDVFGLSLEETGGDIGGAFLLGHNTMRSLARDGGDGLRTGIFALDKDRFDKLFITLRGGYRCTDGFAGARKDENCAEANFAGDNAGPWYHFFGTAFFETYTATPDDTTPEDNGWARTGNVLEQWYREYCPTSWQDPDPEKECINRWGIAAADELLKEQPWMQE